MGPLFFLVLLVPFTLNGFAVREAFFVSFLGSVGVAADQAFAAGFLFFLVTVALAAPRGRDPAVGGGARRTRRGRASSMAEPHGRSRRRRHATTRCPGSSSASRASRGVADGRGRQRLGRRHGRRSSASASRTSRLVEPENLGLAAGLEPRHRARPTASYVLVLNADAWLVGGALDGSSRSPTAHPRAAVVGPRLAEPDGTLQRSVRGFPTVWRLATEYLYLRKLAPRLAGLERVLRGRASTTTRSAPSSG